MNNLEILKTFMDRYGLTHRQVSEITEYSINSTWSWMRQSNSKLVPNKAIELLINHLIERLQMKSEADIRKTIAEIEDMFEILGTRLKDAPNELEFNIHKEHKAELTERLNTLKWVLSD